MYDFVNIVFQLIGVITAVAAVIVTVLLNLKPLKKAIRSKDIKDFKDRIDIRRRKLLQICGVLSIGTVSWGAVQIDPIKAKIKQAIYYLLPQGKNLVINENNGVIHHKILCSDHLPKNISPTPLIRLAIKSRFHGSHKVAILSSITQDASAEDAIEVLMLAVEDNPTSVHIYDKLIKLLGKIKRYEAIHLLLESAENKLEHLAARYPPESKQKKKYMKAISHIQLQREKARERARYAALRF